MKVLKFLNKYKFIFISGLLAAVVFILIYGTRVINPRNVEWILLKGGDMGQHYLGWEFFRHSPWHFPIGLSSNISYPFLVSVIFVNVVLSNIIPQNVDTKLLSSSKVNSKFCN